MAAPTGPCRCTSLIRRCAPPHAHRVGLQVSASCRVLGGAPAHQRGHPVQFHFRLSVPDPHDAPRRLLQFRTAARVAGACPFPEDPREARPVLDRDLSPVGMRAMPRARFAPRNVPQPPEAAPRCPAPPSRHAPPLSRMPLLAAAPRCAVGWLRHPCIILGALSSAEPQKALCGGIPGSFLEPFCGHVLPKVDKLCSKFTFEMPPRRALRGSRLQGYLAHKKHPPPGTLQKDYA